MIKMQTNFKKGVNSINGLVLYCSNRLKKVVNIYSSSIFTFSHTSIISSVNASFIAEEKPLGKAAHYESSNSTV